jgi:branched-chain amino acid transport system substrate-binding protein
MKKAIRLLVLVLALALVAAACGDDDDTAGDDTTTTEATTTTAAGGDDATTTQATTTAAPPAGLSCGDGVTVGVITDQTGSLAVYGAHMLRGIPIGFAYATNGEVGTGDEQTYALEDCQIRVVFKDDQSDAELSTTAARELIEVEGADIIIGSVSSGVTAGLQGLARDNDVILIAAPAAATDITGKDFNENTFRASRNNFQDGIAICEGLTKQYTTFVQIAPDYSFGYGGAEAFTDACTFFGGEFPEDPVFAPADTTDFTPYMETIADSEAEAFLVTWAGGGFIPLVQAAADLGVLDDKALASAFIDNQFMPVFFANAVGSTSTILYHYTLPDNAANDFLAEKVAELGTFPDLFDADGMNAGIMAVEALKASGGASDADSLRAALEGLSFEGPKGLIEVRPEDHVAIQDMYIVTLTNIDDPEFKYYEYVETVRPNPPCKLEGDFAARCGDLPTKFGG